MFKNDARSFARRVTMWPTFCMSINTIDLVLIDKQSVGKRSLHLMDTVNAKKRWMTIYWPVNKFLIKVPHSDTLPKERASFLKVNDIDDISFLRTPDCHHCCSIA
jgi:hypothetical protein